MQRVMKHGVSWVEKNYFLLKQSRGRGWVTGEVWCIAGQRPWVPMSRRIDFILWLMGGTEGFLTGK